MDKFATLSQKELLFKILVKEAATRYKEVLKGLRSASALNPGQTAARGKLEQFYSTGHDVGRGTLIPAARSSAVEPISPKIKRSPLMRDSKVRRDILGETSGAAESLPERPFTPRQEDMRIGLLNNKLDGLVREGRVLPQSHTADALADLGGGGATVVGIGARRFRKMVAEEKGGRMAGARSYLAPGAGRPVIALGNTSGIARAVGDAFPHAPTQRAVASLNAPGHEYRMGGAVLEHELGEAAEMSRRLPSTLSGVRSFLPQNAKAMGVRSGHLGMEPLIRERVQTQGDPQAWGAFDLARRYEGNAGKSTSTLMRQLGYTPQYSPASTHMLPRRQAQFDRFWQNYQGV